MTVLIDEHGDDNEATRCPVCGNPMTHCPRHGRNADPTGWGIGLAHDLGAHTRCHPSGCEQASR